uniref:Uncharacterized protein n=1 Tax=Globodera pallida TaxID=36090 RepID=A0A183C9E9_GLOPA
CTVIPSVELEHDGVTSGAEKDDYSVKELKARMAVLMEGMVAEREFFTRSIGHGSADEEGTDFAQIEENAAMIADATSRRGRRLTRAQRKKKIAELKEEAEAAARAVLRKETIESPKNCTAKKRWSMKTLNG